MKNVADTRIETHYRLTYYLQELGVSQLWARYLKGDNILTKIGSGQVEIEIGMAIPTF